MAAAIGHAGFVEIPMRQQAAQGVLAARRSAIEAHPAQVHRGIFFGGGLHPQNAVGEPGVTDVFPAHVVKRFRTIGGAHAVDLHHDESHLRQFLHAHDGTEAFGRKSRMRPGVDVLNNRIFLGGIVIRGPHDDAVNVGDAVAPARHKRFRRAPSGLRQCRNVGFLQIAYLLAIGGATQFAHRRLVHP